LDLQPGGTVGLARLSAGLTADLPYSRPAWKRFCQRSSAQLALASLCPASTAMDRLDANLPLIWRKNSIQSDCAVTTDRG
jgi:hypothetical protein